MYGERLLAFCESLPTTRAWINIDAFAQDRQVEPQCMHTFRNDDMNIELT